MTPTPEMLREGRCIHFNGGVMMVGQSGEFSDTEIEAARRRISKVLRCRLAQVDDWDAMCYLREQASLKEESNGPSDSR
jgi:hypothetical protein